MRSRYLSIYLIATVCPWMWGVRHKRSGELALLIFSLCLLYLHLLSSMGILFSYSFSRERVSTRISLTYEHGRSFRSCYDLMMAFFFHFLWITVAEDEGEAKDGRAERACIRWLFLILHSTAMAFSFLLLQFDTLIYGYGWLEAGSF